MQVRFYIFLIQCIVLGNEYNLVNVKALIGENIRHPNPNEFLYTVAVVRVYQENNTMGKICIGTLVTQRDVLSAAHCLEGEDLPFTAIVAGSINFTLGLRYTILWWITYDWWISTFTLPTEFELNDICMLRLLINVAQNIIPIPLSNQPNIYYYRSEATIATWTSVDIRILPTIMDLGDVTMITRKTCARKCRSFLVENRRLLSRFLCSVANPSMQLQLGDSGGPLVHQGLLIGINNGYCPPASEAPANKRINIHTGIEFYRTFINTIMAVP